MLYHSTLYLIAQKLQCSLIIKSKDYLDSYFRTVVLPSLSRFRLKMVWPKFVNLFRHCKIFEEKLFSVLHAVVARLMNTKLHAIFYKVCYFYVINSVSTSLECLLVVLLSFSHCLPHFRLQIVTSCIREMNVFLFTSTIKLVFAYFYNIYVKLLLLLDCLTMFRQVVIRKILIFSLSISIFSSFY